jgi:tetratricopeptide (TPR) repeat protein
LPTLREYLNLAMQLIRQGEGQSAESICTQILDFAANHPNVLFALAAAQAQQGKVDQAAEVYKRVLELQPSNAFAHNNIGILYALQKLSDKAIEHFDAAIRHQSNHLDAMVNRARALQEQGRLTESVVQLQAVLNIDSNHRNAHLEIAHCYSRLGDLDNTHFHYARSIEIDPEYPPAHWNLAMALLAKGDYEQGWREYEWRWQCQEFSAFAPSLPIPRWDGSSLEKCRVIVTAEQGIGDCFQFVRYLSTLQERGASVIFRCPPLLTKLLDRFEGIDCLIAEGEELPEADCWVPLLSLPYLLKTELDTVPNPIPYLRANHELSSHWEQQLAQFRCLRIGIVWKGGSKNALDRNRSISLLHFRHLAIEGVQLFSLQKGVTDEEVVNSNWVHFFDHDLDCNNGAFMDTAAILSQLDLLVSCDTAVAHLAGAMGVPVWLAISSAADWRWIRNQEHSAWYPRTRLFWQETLDDWECLFLKMRAQLELKVREQTTG